MPPKQPPFPEVGIPLLDADPPLSISGYLCRPATPGGRRPAMVLMHGCSGLWMHDGTMNTREVAWARAFAEMGYAALVLDSFSARAVENMCSPDTFQETVYDARPADAFSALAWLQQQDFVAPDRVGMMGWSQGGGAVLLTARTDNETRPALPGPGFRAAVAMYPGSCHASVFRSTWTTAIPMMVLIGGKDIWTPADPCRALTGTAAAFGSDVQFHIYPDAYHDFDWPDEDVHPVPQYTTKDGVVPIIGMNPAAAADAHERVGGFLRLALG